MKFLPALFLCLLLLPLLHADPIECIQYRDQAQQTVGDESVHQGKWLIPGTKGVITEMEPILFNKKEPDSSTFYQGFSIQYTKQEETLSLIITSNLFEGFWEVESDKYSPIFTNDRVEIEIPRKNSEWVEVKIKGRTESLFIRCVEL